MQKFQRVSYRALNARQKELFNFQKIAATLADYGFNCIKLADDWKGADFLAYHVKGTRTLKVQLKARITIQKKYRKKDIWMAFPYRGFWYLIEHDRLLAKVEKHTRWTRMKSWRVNGTVHAKYIRAALLDSLIENRIGPVYGPIVKETR